MPDIICLSETKLKNNPWLNTSIPNYSFYHSPSPINAGGVAMYISTKFAVKNECAQFLNAEQCEDMFVEASSPDGKI